MPENQQTPDAQIVEIYKQVIGLRHPALMESWPVLSGHNAKVGQLKGWLVVILEHTGNPVMMTTNGLGNMPSSLGGAGDITQTNKSATRRRIESHYHLKPTDAVVLVAPDGALHDEIDLMVQKHEHAMGMTPMKVFLSHKGADKSLVRNYKRTLVELGFDPWLDEDAMSAGTELERGILQGFADSCAAVFFVTPNYKDENFLASEVDYAIAEKRKKGDRFAIVTLVFEQDGERGAVPDLLRRYVWKEPAGDLEALREIIRAPPVTTGDVYWRQ